MLLEKTNRTIWIIGAGVCLIIVIFAGWLYNKNKTEKSIRTQQKSLSTADPTQTKAMTTENGAVLKEIVVKPDINYQTLRKDGELKNMMGKRKKTLGIKKSLDMIINSDESFTVGDNKVSMRDILEKSSIQKGEIFTEKIESSGAVIPEKKTAYGIYVVQANDNIWNIHFNILKDYYENRGINVSPKADEPIQKGQSSGIGKILKFSETMVMIYNIKEKKVTSNIDLLEPLSKIVVYNMDEVFSLLSQINYETIDRLQFDGKTIWIPAKK